MKKTGIILLWGVLVACASASASLITDSLITDSFNTSNTNDLNTDLATRQTGNLAGSFTYTKGGVNPDKVLIQDNALEVQTAQSATSSDLASQIAQLPDSTYTISADLGWFDAGGLTANHRFFMNLGGTGNLQAEAPLQFGMTTDGNRLQGESKGQFYVGLGDGTAFTTLATVDVSGGNDRSKFWNVTLTIEEGTTDRLLGVNFDGNDLTLTGDTTINFGSTRELFFKTVGSGMSGRFDNLRVIPEPSTLVMICAFSGVMLFVRRVFKI